MMFEEDPEALENLPDNSHLECNVCVTGLDECLTSEDLHKMFSRFGNIKSCKVTLDPSTNKSRGYGFVWFTTERACKFALESKEVPYKTLLYKDFSVRSLEPLVNGNNKLCTMVLSGYPSNFTEEDLVTMIGPETIKNVTFKKKYAEITFKSVKLA